MEFFLFAFFSCLHLHLRYRVSVLIQFHYVCIRSIPVGPDISMISDENHAEEDEVLKTRYVWCSFSNHEMCNVFRINSNVTRSWDRFASLTHTLCLSFMPCKCYNRWMRIETVYHRLFVLFKQNIEWDRGIHTKWKKKLWRKFRISISQ